MSWHVGVNVCYCRSCFSVGLMLIPPGADLNLAMICVVCSAPLTKTTDYSLAQVAAAQAKRVKELEANLMNACYLALMGETT